MDTKKQVNAPKSVEADTAKKQNVSKSGGRFTDTLKGGKANANTRLTLTDSCFDLVVANNPARQVVLVCQLLDDLGGSATVGELNEMILACMHDKADTFWVDSKSEAYVQDIYPVMASYLDKMIGKEDWTSKKGSFTLVEVS
tara:strand:+ start:175 stop:600 length:426 start_codon:yes stop_codon:yes gene_type:complete